MSAGIPQVIVLAIMDQSTNIYNKNIIYTLLISLAQSLYFLTGRLCSETGRLFGFTVTLTHCSILAANLEASSARSHLSFREHLWAKRTSVNIFCWQQIRMNHQNHLPLFFNKHARQKHKLHTQLSWYSITVMLQASLAGSRYWVTTDPSVLGHRRWKHNYC